jgi:Secretion system C-terminal sorting domain/PKD domain
VQFCSTIIVKCILPPPPPCCFGTGKINLNTSGQMVTASDATETSADVIITNRTWNWGDGTTSSQAEAEHYYHHSGTYTIVLTIEGIAGGISFTDEVSQSITVHMAPPCTCPPVNPSVFADSPLQCTAGSHSTCLKVIDYDGEAGTIYQWLSSDNAAGPFAEIPNAIGQQVWINNSSGPKYYKCRCMSALTGGYTLSEVVGINDQHFSATATATPDAVCSGATATISVLPDSEPHYQWFPNNASTSTVVVSPTATTLYEVFVRNAAGCGAQATQQIVVNPCPTNDDITSATLVNSTGGAYPQSNCYNSSLEFAQTSAEGNPANVLPGGGQDVWYKVVAPSGALRFVANSSTVDIVLELHNASFVQVDMQNDITGAGGETMVSTGLTAGAIYYLAVRSYDGSLGAFSVCIQSLTASFCSGGSGSYELCSNFKPKWTGANNYTFNFTPTGATSGVPTSVTAAGSVNLSHPALALRHGGTYNVTVDAIYNLPEGITVVTGSTVCSIVINPHASVEVKQTQRCPATLLKGSVLQGKPFICSATGFTVEFTELNACGGTAIGMPFTAFTSGASASINLSTVTGVLGGGHWYQVRWRPTFSYGNGNYGNPQTIFVGGSAMGTEAIEENNLDSKSISSVGLVASIYPNPNNGDMVNINVANATNERIYVRIYNQLGQVVYKQGFAVDQTLNTIIVFESELASGLYFTEIVDGENKTTLKMIIEK